MDQVEVSVIMTVKNGARLVKPLVSFFSDLSSTRDRGGE